MLSFAKKELGILEKESDPRLVGVHLILLHNITWLS
jgi:hypothetical protein